MSLNSRFGLAQKRENLGINSFFDGVRISTIAIDFDGTNLGLRSESQRWIPAFDWSKTELRTINVNLDGTTRVEIDRTELLLPVLSMIECAKAGVTRDRTRLARIDDADSQPSIGEKTSSIRSMSISMASIYDDRPKIDPHRQRHSRWNLESTNRIWALVLQRTDVRTENKHKVFHRSYAVNIDLTEIIVSDR